VNDLLLSFYGDDFTGSTDALESLTLGGIRTILFTQPPTNEQLERHPDLQAFGIAGMTRSMPPDEMERTLRPAFQSLKASGAPIVHYKVCSTFDSSPTVGSIGRVIDIAAEIFDCNTIPVLAAAPALGRYCIFGNLFARYGADGPVYRIDRHPSMSRHPITPMHEADLRLHLAKQTDKQIALLDIFQLDHSQVTLDSCTAPVVLIDLLHEKQLAKAGSILSQAKFVVGSSGVESALCAYWGSQPRSIAPLQPAQPILVVSGSCSPVTGSQIQHALSHSFKRVSFNATSAISDASNLLNRGTSVIVDTQQASSGADIGPTLARVARSILEESEVRRILIAGGDTSGHIARALGIESLEMIAPLTRGAPLCRATAPGSPADGREFIFKGGQIGPVDFFTSVEAR